MKKFWKYSVIFLLLLCVFAPSGVVRATDFSDCVTKNTKNGMSQADAETACTGMAGDPQTNQTATNTSGQTQAYADCLASGGDTTSCAKSSGYTNPTPTTPGSCNPLNFSPGNCVYSILAWVTSGILVIMSWLLWLAGTGLDWILNYTILQMSQNISGMTGINIVWKVIRDLSNIVFIFILLYEAIKLILSQSDTGKIKSIIAGIVITALLINFSLFFTKVIIDASNVVTVGFYQSIVGAGNTNGQTTTISGSGAGNTYTIQKGLSGAFVNQLYMVSFYTQQDPSKMNSTGGQDYKSAMMINLGGSVLFLVLAFVFFAVAIMFLIRYIVLVVLMMSAPLGYLGFGLPLLKSTQSQWWNTLLGQCIFAPLWMFCCWAILMLIGSPGFLTLQGGATLKSLSDSSATGLGTLFGSNAGAANPSGVALIINFVLVIFLVIGSLTLAKKYAGQGSGYVSQATGKLTAFAGGAVMGGAAMAGRNSIGRAANWAANNEKLKGAAANNVFARGLLKASNKTANSTFDARNTKAVGQTTGALGMNIGKGTKDTLRTVQKAKAEKEAKFAETLKPSDAHIAEMKKAPEKRVVENQAAVDERKKKMSDPEFVKKKEEAKRKYLESDEYKNSDVYKKAEAEKVANEAKLKPETEKDLKLGEELKGLEKQRSESMSLSKQKELDDQIKVKKQEIDGQKKKIDEVKKEIAENNTATKAMEKHKEEWKTAEQRNIESEIGSFETAIKEDKKTIEDINGLYATRVKAYADNLKGTQHHMLKYAGAVGGMIGGAALGAPVLATAGAGYLGYRLYTHATNWKGDRQAAADRVRKVAKQETKKERAERTAREYLEEQAEEKKKAGGGEAEKPKAENESGGGEKSKEKTS